MGIHCFLGLLQYQPAAGHDSGGISEPVNNLRASPRDAPLMQLISSTNSERQNNGKHEMRAVPGLPPALGRQHTEQSVQNKMGGFVQRQRGFHRWDIASPTHQ